MALIYALVLLSVPLVSANLGQEVAQTNAGAVGNTADITQNQPIEAPSFNQVPGGPASGGDTDGGFAATRLGSALGQLRPGADPTQVGIKFIIGFWHQVMLDLQLADYSRTNEQGSEISAPENPGPCYSSRALAIAHLAMYDAYVGVTEEGATYLEYKDADLPKNNKDISDEIKPTAAAVAAGTAASLVLKDLYRNPADRAKVDASTTSFNNILSEQFAAFPDVVGIFSGDSNWPAVVSSTHLQNRGADGSTNGLPFVEFNSARQGATAPYAHVPDPTAVDPESGAQQFVYAPHWGGVRPFGSGLPNPLANKPPLSNNYVKDFQEVAKLGELTADVGGAGGRTADQTRTGIWWAYDGGFRIGVPPRLYNQIVDDIIITEVGANSPQLATGFQLVRLYAMVNVALADSGIAAWRDKYRFNFWRPIIGIRRADETEEVATFQDAEWVQLGAPNTNRNRPGINPAFPAYPSGHATFGTSALEVAKAVLNIPDAKQFTMHSDEFNGKAVDDVYCSKFGDCVADPGNLIDPAIANKRPNLPRSLTIDQAIQQNLEGRVYLGVHWRFDQTVGGELGRAVASSVVNGFPYRG